MNRDRGITNQVELDAVIVEDRLRPCVIRSRGPPDGRGPAPAQDGSDLIRRRAPLHPQQPRRPPPAGMPARSAREARATELRQPGIRCRRWSLPDQTRSSAGLGSMDGRRGTVSLLNLYGQTEGHDETP